MLLCYCSIIPKMVHAKYYMIELFRAHLFVLWVIFINYDNMSFCRLNYAIYIMHFIESMVIRGQIIIMDAALPKLMCRSAYHEGSRRGLILGRAVLLYFLFYNYCILKETLYVICKIFILYQSIWVVLNQWTYCARIV